MERKGRPPEGAALLPAGRLWLLAEFGGATPDEAKERAQEAMADISRHGRAGALDLRLVDDPREQRMLWKLREAGVGASRVPGEEEAWPSWEDAAVAPERLGDYLRDFMALLKRHGYAFTIFGHFGQGCVHARITFKTRTAEGVRDYRRFLQEAADLVSAYGGSLSGEHGDGQARGELLPKMYGPALVRAFQEFKAIWDPLGKMNPGKVVSPYPLDTNLRIGPDYRPLPVLTRFRFPDDHGSMAEASRRCFGVGKCRALEGGTMCPSFRATREEMHTTRGRAHLLFEMLRGDALRDGFRDPAVKEALDLCLACKGCKGDCPVQVDMATYKAEFLSHYYEGRPRPIAAFVQGRIFRWARLASLAPGLANLLTQTRGLSAMMKAAAGMAPERPLPPFARQTFRSWFRARPERNAGMPRVILWPDTFNNYFYPQTARAAVEVLEAAGRQVVIPPQVLCCGRPLYDYGLLDEAKAKLAEILAALRPEIEAGVPVVGLEPSCVSVFRDELHGLLPDDEDARRLAGQTFLLSEFLAQAAREGRAVPRVPRRAIVHGHCHHKSLFGMDDEEAVLKHAGVDAQLLDSGCCGLAGGFGYERRHYDLSMKIGELALLPAVRAAPPEALIVADGFSCRSQIEHGTHRRALHLAEVLKLGLGGDKDKAAASGPYPERAFPSEAARPRAFGLLGVAVAGLCCVLGVRWLARR
jgi:Fe-S oxidoreductase